MSLLDFLNSDEARMGLGLLAAGGPSATPMNAFQRIQMAQQGMDANTQSKLKSRLLESQLAENASQDTLRKAQAEQLMREQKAKEDALARMRMRTGGAPGVPGGAGMVQGMTADDVLDARLAGLPDITPLWQATRPNMVEIAPGMYADKNTIQPGVNQQALAARTQDRLQQSDIGMRGEFVEFEDKEGRIWKVPKAATVAPPPVPLPGRQFGAPSGYGTEAQMRTTAQGDMGADPNAARREIAAMERDLATPGKVPDQASRQALTAQIAEMQRQLGAVRAPAPMIGPGAGSGAVNPMQEPAPAGMPAGAIPSGMSRAETDAADTAKLRANEQVKADTVRDTAQQAKTKSANEMLGDIARARELLKQSPTGSGMGAARDKLYNSAGINTKSAEIAARLDPISGSLTRNIPRMEGPQSDGDREEYKTQAGRVADRTIPPEQRLAALEEVERINKKYASLNGGTADSGDKPVSRLKTAPSDADIKNTAMKYGISPAEVRKRLGID